MLVTAYNDNMKIFQQMTHKNAKKVRKRTSQLIHIRFFAEKCIQTLKQWNICMWLNLSGGY